MSPHDETLRLCEELLASLSAAQTHLRVLAALQLDFSSTLKTYRDALKRSHDLLDEAGVVSATLAFSDLGGRDDTDELLSLAIHGTLEPDEDTDEREREAGAPAVTVTVGQTSPNTPAVPIDDGPEGTADVGAPLGTDETSSERARETQVYDASELHEGSDEIGVASEGDEAEVPTLLLEPDEGDVVVMEEDEEAATESMTPAQARARALALAAEEDAAELELDLDEVPLADVEQTEETGEHTDKVPFDDEEATVVLDASDLEEIVEEIEDDETTQPVGIHPEVTEDEPDQASVDEVIVTMEQAAQEVEKVKSTPPPTARAPARPTPKVKPKVKAKKPARTAKDVSAKFYAASASIPTIRDESTPKPRAAAVKLGSEGQPAQVLGDEQEDEPIAVPGVENEDALDLDTKGLTLEVESAWDDWEEEEEEEEEEEILELSEDLLEAVGPEEEPQTMSPKELDELLERARRAARQGNIETGVNYFSDVLDADPDRVDAYIGRGRLYLDLGDFSRAMSDFTVAEDLEPESPEPQVAVGDLYFARKDYRKAIEFFDTALAMKPDHAMAFCRRGISHYYRRNYKQALDDLTEAVRLDPDIPNIKTFVSMAKKKARTK